MRGIVGVFWMVSTLLVAMPAHADPTRIGSQNTARIREVRERDLASARERLRAQPTLPQEQKQICDLLQEIGGLLVLHGDVESARRRFEESLALAQDFARQEPTVVTFRIESAQSHAQLGHLSADLDNLENARQHYVQAIEAIRSDLAADPSAASIATFVSVDLGELAQRQGDFGSALRFFEQAQTFAEHLSDADGLTPLHRSEIGVKVGTVLVETGDLTGALARFEEDIGVRRSLVAGQPRSPFRRSLVRSLWRAGDVNVVLGDLSAARVKFEEAVAILQDLAERNPQSSNVQADLVTAISKLNGLSEASPVR